MKLKLLAPHIVADVWLPEGTVLDPAPDGYAATHLMEGLDPEGVAAVTAATLACFGRFPGPDGLFPPSGAPLDDPPIQRIMAENQPVYHFIWQP
jgi:hypothetical protein